MEKFPISQVAHDASKQYSSLMSKMFWPRSNPTLLAGELSNPTFYLKKSYTCSRIQYIVAKFIWVNQPIDAYYLTLDERHCGLYLVVGSKMQHSCRGELQGRHKQRRPLLIAVRYGTRSIRCLIRYGYGIWMEIHIDGRCAWNIQFVCANRRRLHWSDDVAIRLDGICPRPSLSTRASASFLI